ncbi:MAG: MBL fold metallo-hydrolase [Eubacterium sp.]|nr:MBL fold metallo-hydrolase [Eubacterium sp.]
MLHYDLRFEKNDGNEDILSLDVFPMPILDSRMYVLKSGDELLIVDPNFISEKNIPILHKLCAKHSSATVLFTHSHYDHIAGLNLLRKLIPVKAYASTICNEKLKDSHKNLSAFSMALVMDKDPQLQKYCETYFDFDYRCEADEEYDYNSVSSSSESTSSDLKSNSNIIYNLEITFGKYNIRTISTPGHSDCSQCIEIRLSEDIKNDAVSAPITVFTGDSLVNGHPVITRFPSGSKKIYKNITLPYLESLPSDTLILPGHGDPAHLGEIIQYSKI